MEYAVFSAYESDSTKRVIDVEMPSARGGHAMTLVGNP